MSIEAEQLDRRRVDRARRRVVGEPLDAQERPVEEELRRQGRDGEIEALDAQDWACRTGCRPPPPRSRQQEADQMVEARQPQREIVGGIGADRHEGAGAERDLAAIAHQHVEPDRGQRQDQRPDQHARV